MVFVKRHRMKDYCRGFTQSSQSLNCTLSFGRQRQRNMLKCVPRVQHEYFSTFNQSYHWFVALSLSWSYLLVSIITCHQKNISRANSTKHNVTGCRTHAVVVQKRFCFRFVFCFCFCFCFFVGSATVAKCNLQDSTSCNGVCKLSHRAETNGIW